MMTYEPPVGIAITVKCLNCNSVLRLYKTDKSSIYGGETIAKQHRILKEFTKLHSRCGCLETTGELPPLVIKLDEYGISRIEEIGSVCGEL